MLFIIILNDASWVLIIKNIHAQLPKVSTQSIHCFRSSSQLRKLKITQLIKMKY